jgi:hypothetical protein
MFPNFKEKIKTALLVFLISLFSLTLFTFVFRDLIVSSYVEKKVRQFNSKYDADLTIERVHIQWLASVLVTGVCLKPHTGDTLLKIDSLYLSIAEWKLLAGRVAINDLELRDFNLRMVRTNHSDNFSFLFKGGGKEERIDSLPETLNYGDAIDRIAELTFDKIPAWLHIHNFSVAGITNGHEISLHVDHFAIEKRKFAVPVVVREDSVTQHWLVTGWIDKGERSLMATLHSMDNRKVTVPFIQYKWNATVRFDTVTYGIGERFTNDTVATIFGKASVSGLELDHDAIARQTVTIERLAMDYNLNIGSNYAEVDSSTQVVFNQLTVNPYLKYQHKPVQQITLSVTEPAFPARDLFASIPPGLFSTVDGMKVTGDLSFYLKFFVDLSMPDSLIFDCELKRHKFGVTSYGNTYLTRINEPFLYTAYEKGDPVRSFMVGPENPNFRGLEKIPSFLKYAVLTSEDPSFFLHRGFLLDAFRESIILDIKERKFARGGSTISMQLVKNVFLSRQKTIARKLEEALIVWLIENQNLCTKERMFEVYLNIIEWGPLVYGANEASRFYFNKDVARLTLDESIFLASIVPKPKWFRYSFDETGRLRESQDGYFRLVSEKMFNKGWISASDLEKVKMDVTLKGPARLLLKKVDSILVDTTEYRE